MLSLTKSRLAGKTFLQTLFFFLLVTQICVAQSPVISVSPDSLGEDLFSGKTSEQVLTIYNNGGSDLTFEINVKDNIESLLLNSTGNYSIVSSTQPLETNDRPTTENMSYSGNILSLDNSFQFEKNEKLFEENSLAGGLKLLLITSGGYPSEIKNALLNFPDVQQVDIFDAYSSTPTLTELLPYQSVIAMNNSSYADPVAMGNVLADYVDEGRGLILTVATFADGWEIKGRLLDDGYFPFNLGNGPAGSASLGTFNSSHPIMQGVITAYGDLLVDLTLANGAEQIASWNTGWPFVATKGKNVAAVNIYVTEPGAWTGDIPLILHNAAFWAGGCGWLSAEPDSGTIPAGSSMNVTMSFDAAGLSGGEYNANIKISSNDPVTPELIIPAHLNVTDAPAIYTGISSINFGEVFLGVTDTFYLEVKNIGSQDLLIFSAVVQPAEYSVHPAFAGIDPGENEIFSVTFSPQNVGGYPGTLTFSSNDPLNGTYILNINGQGVEPPVIVVSPDSLVVGVLPGSTRAKILAISNQGESNLYFDIRGGFSSANYALQFDGINGYVEVPDNPQLSAIGSEFTLEFWIKTEEYPTTYQEVLGKWGVGWTEDDEYDVDFHPDGRILIGISGNLGGPSIESNPIQFNTWTHIAGVFNANISSLQIFVNGILENSTNTSTVIMDRDTDQPFRIGTYDFEWFPFFNGRLDEVRIWNIARTQNEIQTYMNEQLTGIEPGLLGCWQLDEGVGNAAYDKSLNANHGSLHNGVLWTNSAAPIEPGWFFMSVDSGVCSPHSSMNIEFLFDATELDTGDYYATIIINSNDPVNPSVVIPVHMIVSTMVGVGDNLNIPLAFNLYQNYPNPFNPSTKIKYSVPQSSIVVIKVFDVLGNEIETLVNEEKPAGTYELTWNASNLPSGVYFYQLKAGSFIETKKMLLLK